MERGQLLNELLLTYGWAMVGVVVLITTIGFYAGFYVKALPDECTMEPPFSCREHRAQENGLLSIGIQNNALSDLGPIAIRLECADDATLLQRINLPVVRSLEPLNGSLLVFNCSAADEDPLTAGIELRYHKNGESIEHTARGYFRAHRQ